LRLRQLATGSDQEILPPAEATLFGPEVSPDGGWVYYGVRREEGSLYRLPMLGGHPQRVLEDVAGEFDISPNGKRIAFQRDGGEKGLELMVADIDGSDQRVLLDRTSQGQDQLAWSGDGERIVFADRDPSLSLGAVVRWMPVDGGEVANLGSEVWQLFDMASMPGDHGLLISAAVGGAAFQLPPQLWRLQPGVDPARLTHDNQEYISPSVDGSGRSLVAVQRRSERTYLVLPDGDERRARRVAFTSLAGPYWCGMTWTRDGRLLYEDLDGEELHIWAVNADGSDAVRLTRAGRFNMAATISPDGRTMAFFSDRDGQFRIWLTDLDGSNPRRLTEDDLMEVFPRFSPDGRWVVFHVFDQEGRAYIRKAPAAGGPSTVLIEEESYLPAVSHDGTKLAFFSGGESKDSFIKIADFRTGQVIKRFKQSSAWFPFLQWTLDDRGVAFVGGSTTGNIMVRPVDGGPTRQLTHFSDESVLGFSWSPDGSSLALATERRSSDVVMIQGFEAAAD